VLDPLTKAYLTKFPAEAARSILRLQPNDLNGILEAMPRAVAANVLEHMASASASRCLGNLTNKTINEILAHMQIPSSVAILRHMNHDQVKELLERMPRTMALRLRLRLRYSETVIGSLVDANVVTLIPEHHVSDALRLYRREGQHTGHTLYVLDQDRHLTGEVHLHDLLGARDRTPIRAIMQPIPVVLNARAALQSVTTHPAWLTNDSLPVVNRNNVYQGVLRRAKVTVKEQKLINNVTDHSELALTRAALADIFWMALGALFTGGAGAAKRNGMED